MPEKDQSFDSFTQWVNMAPSWLTRRGPYVRAVCYDTTGRIMQDGGDFMRARDEGCFPVRWLWPGDNIFDAIKKGSCDDGSAFCDSHS